MKKILLLSFSFFIFSFHFIAAQPTLGNLTSYSIVSDNSVRLFSGSSGLLLEFPSRDIVKITLLPTLSTLPDSSFALLNPILEPISVNVTDAPSSLTLSTGSISVIVSKSPILLSITSSSGQEILPTSSLDQFIWNGNNRTVQISLPQSVNFYGSGARGKSLRLNGRSFESYNTQVGGYHSPAETMNINVPFITTDSQIGMFIDNTYPLYFNFFGGTQNTMQCNTKGGELSLYLFVGNQQKQLELYTQLTGTQPLPPRWAFGFIQSKFGYRNEVQAQTFVNTIRNKRIPCDAIVLDLYWFENMGDISWSSNTFPNHQAMIRDFLNRGMKTVVITEPYIIQKSKNYSEGSSKGYFAKNTNNSTYNLEGWWSCGCNAALLDITNPEAAQWWWNKHTGFWGDLGGIWTDLGEPERHNGDMIHHLGSADKVHNIYNLLWAETIFKGFNVFKPNQRLFNLTRSGFAGMQRYGAITWSGDVAASFQGLAGQIPMSLNMGLSGMPYHHSDLGGFTGTTTTELYIRWMQFGTFGPIMRSHGVDNQVREPWGYGENAENIAKEYIELRYQLLPYIYTLAHEAQTNGTPLLRPLFWGKNSAGSFANVYDSFLFGDNFFVAPVLSAGAVSRTVQFPEGQWINFYDNTIYYGPVSAQVPAPLSRIPLFVRIGSITPLMPVMQCTDEFPMDSLRLLIYPSLNGSASTFTLYEDDGKTLEYLNGAYRKTTFSQTTSPDGMAVTIEKPVGSYSTMLAQRIYTIDMRLVDKSPLSVLVNNDNIPGAGSETEFRLSSKSYFYTGTSLLVKFTTSSDSSYVVMLNGVGPLSGGEEPTLATDFKLNQNYPNPFNPSTRISWVNATTSRQILTVYDVLGNQVAVLLDEIKPAGEHEIEFVAQALPGGVYFYKLQSGNSISVKKMVLLK